MRTEFDAVIVGAGPAGSAAATLLAGAGWRVALVERQRFPRRKVCGECLAASNLPLLETLGVLGSFERRAGAELRRVALHRAEQEVTADLPAGPTAGHQWGRALGREVLDALLLERARMLGVEVLQPWAAQSIGGAAGAWRCELRWLDGTGSRYLHAAVAVDAHGSWEHLPAGRPQQLAAKGGADLFAFKANFLGATLAEGVINLLALDGGYGGMVVAEGGVTTLACCVRRDRLESLRRASPGVRAGEAVQAWLQRECGRVRGALKGAVRDGPWLACGPIDPGMRLQADDEVFRIGNAAGEAHPILGEGISMALQSAALLCSHLLAADRPGGMRAPGWQRELGRRYAADWQRQFGPRVQLAAAFAGAAMQPHAAALLMAGARAWPGLLTLGARWGGKVRTGSGAGPDAVPARPSTVQVPHS